MAQDNMKIGDAAEDLLTYWASQAGINVIAPQRDRTGWDREFEFPVDDCDEGQELLDRRPPEMICRIQVKATRNTHKRREPIKLDNWARFVNWPIPCFFVIIEYGAGPDPTAAYLVHVGRDWIEKILRRLRQLAAENQNATLNPTSQAASPKSGAKQAHEITVGVTWSDENRLPELSGHALAKAIRGFVGNARDYTKQKSAWIDSVGYESQNASFSFSAAADATGYESLANLALGIEERLPVSSFARSDLRFGIPLPNGEDGPIDAVIESLEPSEVSESTVTVVGSDSLRSVRLRCNTRTSMGVFPFLPKEFWKVRLATTFVSFLISVADSKARCDFGIRNFYDPVCLGDFADLAEVVAILDESEGEKLTVACELPLWAKSATLAGSLFVPALDPELVNSVRVAEHTWLIGRAFGLQREHLVVPADLMDQAEQIAVLHAVFHTDPTTVRTVSSWDGGPEATDSVASLLYHAAGIGDVVLVAFVAVSGEWHTEEVDGDARLIVNGTPRVIHTESVVRSKWEEWLREILEKRMLSACDVLERKHNIDHVAYMLPTAGNEQ